MMTQTEDNRERLEAGPSAFRRIALGLLLAVIGLAALTFAAGAIAALLHGADQPIAAAAFSAAALAVAGACTWGLARLKPWRGSGEPVGPSTRRARSMMLICSALGVVIAVMLIFGTSGPAEPGGVFSDQPLPQWLAAAVIAVWLSAVPIVSWLWFRSVDEHEAQAYNIGGVVALHVYYLGLPAWWIAWRGGFLPEPQHGTLFALVTIVWLAAWAWRRYR